MIQGPDAASNKFLTDINQIKNRIDTAQRQISSGRRMNSVSDDPDQVAGLLSLRSSLSSVEGIKQNLGRVRTEVDIAEQALQSSTLVVDRILSLGAAGATDITTEDGRRTMSLEIGDLLRQLVGAANTQVEGRYVFAGDSDLAPPYTIDLSLDDPFSAYQGTATTREVQHPNGIRFPISRNAGEIFDSADPANNIFDHANDLRIALRDNDVAGVNTALGELREAAVFLSNQLAFYGTVQNQVNEATDFAGKQEFRLKAQISSVQDADLVAAILELQDATTHQEAALQAHAARPRTSLFDYIR